MKAVLKLLLVAMLACSCRAQPFDLSFAPPEEVIKQLTHSMLGTGQPFSYRNEHANQTLWIFQPADLKDNERRPGVLFIHCREGIRYFHQTMSEVETFLAKLDCVDLNN